MKEGLIQYDKRMGWRGTIDNYQDKELFFNNKINNLINPFPQKWKLAIVDNIKNDFVYISY